MNSKPIKIPGPDHPRLENIADAGVPSLSSIGPKKHGCARNVVFGGLKNGKVNHLQMNSREEIRQALEDY